MLAAFGRPATAKEKATLNAFLEAQTARWQAAPDGKADARRRAVADLCHMLLGANEFAYLD